MNLMELFHCERKFVSQFTNEVKTSFGYLYYNLDNPTSHDSNHALITDINHIEDTLKSIIKFYQKKNITPRIYSSFTEKVSLDKLMPYLKKDNFHIDINNDCEYFYLKQLPRECDHDLEIKRVYQLDKDLEELIYLVNKDVYTIKVLKENLKNNNFHLLIAYKNQLPVAIASINRLKNYTRVDDVMTHINHRRNGYANALVNYLVFYHHRLSDNVLYLYADDKNAKRIYVNNGFKEIILKEPIFTAYHNK